MATRTSEEQWAIETLLAVSMKNQETIMMSLVILAQQQGGIQMETITNIYREMKKYNETILNKLYTIERPEKAK